MSYDFRKECNEAIYAGERAKNSLYNALTELERAGTWGIVDMLSSRSLFFSLIKRSKMNNAQHYMEVAKDDIRVFNRELHDVQVEGNLNIETGDFLSFADWFFDSLLVDWLVQDRIKNAKRQVEDAIRQIDRILDQLRRY